MVPLLIAADSETGTPPVGAFPSSVTVAVAGCPPVTSAGATITETTEAGRIESDAFVVSPPATTVIVAVAVVGTPGVLIRKVA
jgi:hypothetical protein